MSAARVHHHSRPSVIVPTTPQAGKRGQPHGVYVCVCVCKTEKSELRSKHKIFRQITVQNFKKRRER